MIQFEKNLYNKGVKYIAGIDEVGRGPLAGPFVCAAVILDLGRVLEPRNYDVSQEITDLYNLINDSKKISAKKRFLLDEFIRKEAISYSIIEVSNKELDRRGISGTTQFAFAESLKKLKKIPTHVFTDRFEIKNLAKQSQTNIIKGDTKSISIAAASIIAKVYRDKIMIEMHEKYPVYGFNTHMGYGTKKHREAIFEHGPCEIHRKSFEPIKSMLRKLN